MSLLGPDRPGQPHQLGPPLTGHTGFVTSMAVTPHGRTLATGSYDGTAIAWDVTDRAQPHQLGPPLRSGTLVVWSVAFSPDGRTLAVGIGASTVVLWDLAALNQIRDHAVQRACAVTHGGLDRDEWARRIPNLPHRDSCPPDNG